MRERLWEMTLLPPHSCQCLSALHLEAFQCTALTRQPRTLTRRQHCLHFFCVIPTHPSAIAQRLTHSSGVPSLLFGWLAMHRERNERKPRLHCHTKHSFTYRKLANNVCNACVSEERANKLGTTNMLATHSMCPAQQPAYLGQAIPLTQRTRCFPHPCRQHSELV